MADIDGNAIAEVRRLPQLVCRAEYCAHNLGGEFCNAAEIEINEDTRYGSEKTDCSTFIPRDFSGSLLSLDNVNYAGLVAQAFSEDRVASPDLMCTVISCVHNKGGKMCLAEQVEVLEHRALSSPETLCGTYRQE